MEHQLEAQIQHRDEAEPSPGAGGDQLALRVDGEDGECPVALVEGVSQDREWPPFHSHPWDELTDVVEGEVEFRVGDTTDTGGPGTVAALPRGVPHTLRVLEGTARYLMVTLGAPAIPFLREVGALYAQGPTLERLVEVAGRHGVVPVPD